MKNLIILLLISSCHSASYWKRDCVWNSGRVCGDYRLIKINEVRVKDENN